jgi:hypothetical protein
MSRDQADQSTGYPPVKPVEWEQAQSAVGSGQASSGARGGPARLAADQKVITDALAAVVEKHRAEIASAPMAPEARKYVLDLLDAVFLDMLETVLDEFSALGLPFDKRGARS